MKSGITSIGLIIKMIFILARLHPKNSNVIVLKLLLGNANNVKNIVRENNNKNTAIPRIGNTGINGLGFVNINKLKTKRVKLPRQYFRKMSNLFKYASIILYLSN